MFQWLKKITGGDKPIEVCDCESCAEFETTDDPGTMPPPTNYVVVLPHIQYGMAVSGPEEDVWAHMIDDEGGYLRFYSNDGSLVAEFAPGAWRNFFIAGDDDDDDFSMLRREQKDALRALKRGEGI